MKKAIFATVALLLSWPSGAMAQLWANSWVTKDRFYLEETSRGPRTEVPKTIWPYPGDGNPYTGKESPAEPGRYFQRYENGSPAGSSGNSKGPYQYQYNPYRFRW
jgi:hypothetical protein